MMIPFVDLKPYVELVGTGTYHDDAFWRPVSELLTAHEFIGGGPTTQRFEAELMTKLGTKHAVACANGTDALQLALRASSIQRAHRVAMPNITFWATFEAIVNVGATPILLDIDATDFQLSYDELTRAHRVRPLHAVVLPHLFGWCSAQLGDIRSFCRSQAITLIEDGAQAFGVKYEGKSVFEDADVATLSFHPAKVIGGIGDGGAVLTRSPRIASKVRMLANHGRSSHFEHAAVGWNSRMDAIQAAWLLRALDVSDKVIAERRRLVRLYLMRLVGYVNGAQVGWPTDASDNGYLQLNILRQRDPYVVQQRLHDLGVEGRRIYPISIADQPGAKGIVPAGDMPNSREFAVHAFCLPLWYGMTDKQVEQCITAFEEATKR